MTKETKSKEKEEVQFDSDRPTLPNTQKAPDKNILSHNWQENSPAIDLRDVSLQNGQNLVAEAQAAEERVKEDKKEKEKPLSEAEYERRTKLDVSNKEYINPSLDHQAKK